MMLKWLALLALLASPAFAQSSVQQSGPVVPGHIVCFTGAFGSVYDCGPGGGALAIGQTSIIGGQNGAVLVDNNGTLGSESLSGVLGNFLSSPGQIGNVQPSTGNFTAVTATSVSESLSLITGAAPVSLSAGPQTVIIRQIAPSAISVVLPAAAFYPACPAVACPSFTVKSGTATTSVLSADGKLVEGVSSFVMPVALEAVTFVLDGVQWDAI